MKKKDELSKIDSCLNNADPNEPIFVIRAKDAVGAMTVRHWATMSEGIHEPDKIKDALKLADEMSKWRSSKKHPKAEPAVKE